jgi:hypothetical protein
MTFFSRSSFWTLRPRRAQPPLSLPQVDSSSDLHPPMPSSVNPPSSPAPFGGPRPLTPLGTGGGGCSGGGGGSSGGGGGGGGDGGDRRHRRNRSGGGGGGNDIDGGNSTGGTTTPTTGQGRGGTPWSSFYNPCSSTITMCQVPSIPLHAFFAASPVGPPFMPPLASLPLPSAPPPQP